MPLQQRPREERHPARKLRLDAPALVTCVVAALAAVVCVVIGAKHGYDFVRLLLDRGHIATRNAELFAACAWLGGALALGLGVGLLVRLMYRINGSAEAPSGAVAGGTPDGSGRRR